MSRSLGAALAATVRRLERAGIELPRLEARLLIEQATGLSREAQLASPERHLSPVEEERLEALVGRRLRREPLAYVLGRKEFRGLVFEVGPEVLVPRPESELLVDVAVERLADRRAPCLRMVDIGTGSGCLMIALLLELPHSFAIGTDLSLPALRLARRNAVTHGVQERARFVCTHFAEALAGPFDLVIANPPYLTTAELAAAPPELAFEPALALASGPSGLEAYRAIAADLPRILAPEGVAVLELAAGRASSIAAVFAEAGLAVIDELADLAGLPRVLVVANADDRRRNGSDKLESF
ncbi:Release factor glutamine methyltransferase [bacterium HR40]|nr:Release factor glutamine methyltransferase [bacterium HR40]